MTDILPIDAALPALIAALGATRQAVLQAPPGAGKTTRVPLALLNSGLVQGRIILLEPRRLAARAAAERMAETLGEKVGQTVGYRIRGEAKVSRTTRIEVVTEGVFTRMIADDPQAAEDGCYADLAWTSQRLWNDDEDVVATPTLARAVAVDQLGQPVAPRPVVLAAVVTRPVGLTREPVVGAAVDDELRVDRIAEFPRLPVREGQEDDVAGAGQAALLQREHRDLAIVRPRSPPPYSSLEVPKSSQDRKSVV